MTTQTIEQRAAKFYNNAYYDVQKRDAYQLIKLLVEEIERLKAERAKQVETLEDRA